MTLPLPHGAIKGLGTDIVDIARIRKIVEKNQERFLNLVFTTDEQAYCLQMKNPYPHLAVRFAAKEAVSKAFATGIGQVLDWKSIEIVKGSEGQPLVKLDAKGDRLLKQLGGTIVWVSLSHTQTLAQATALISE